MSIGFPRTSNALESFNKNVEEVETLKNLLLIDNFVDVFILFIFNLNTARSHPVGLLLSSELICKESIWSDT